MGTHSLQIPQPPPSPGEQGGTLVARPGRPIASRPLAHRPASAPRGAMPPGLRAWGKPHRLLVLVLLLAGGLIAYATISSPAGGNPTAGTAAAPAQVKAWIAQADSVLIAHGTPASDLDPAATWLIIQHESGGNPHAVNGSDSNAAAGHPSKGLMQTIQPTFDRWALPGHGDIYNPVDNIIAGVRYAIGRYGSLANVPGVRSVRAGGRYRPY